MNATQSEAKLPCGHEAIYERRDVDRPYCLMCGIYSPEKTGPDRAHYHRMLDQAMDESREGESFLPRFVALIIHELRVSKRSCDDHVDCDKAMDDEMKRGGTFLHHPRKP